MSGLPASWVERTWSEPSPRFASHAQPEPKWPTAASVNFFTNSAEPPNDFRSASAIAPFGSPPPRGERLLQ